MDIKDKARQFNEQGFCVVESALSPKKCGELAGMLNAYWKSVGSPELLEFGFGIHPMLTKVPDAAPYLAEPAVLDVVAEVLQDDVRLMHAGARMSNENSGDRIGWHNHYSWDEAGLLTRAKTERLLYGYYLEGSNAEAGPLIVLPRRLNGPLLEPLDDRMNAWPGEMRVEAPPGSAVVFDTALWHAAAKGSRPGIRHLFGTHAQGWSETRPHPEDNCVDGPEVAATIRDNALFRGLVRQG